MKCIVSKEQLIEAVGNLQSIVTAKPPLPLFGNFLLEAHGQELLLTSTDMVVGMSCRIPANVIEEGSTTLPTRRFFQLLRELSAEMVELSSDPHQLVQVQAGGSYFKLHGLSPKEYPPLPALEESGSILLPQQVLKEALFKTSFAISKDDSRYQLTGLLMLLQGEVALFVAADGKRLARCAVPLPGMNCHGRFILPAKAVAELERCLKESHDPVRIYLDQDKVGFEWGSMRLITRLLMGTYPDFEQILLKRIQLEVVLPTQELISLLRQVALFVPEENPAASFIFEEGRLLLSAFSSQVGECQLSMPIHYAGPRFTIAFNPSLFLDILRHVHDEAVSLKLDDPSFVGMITDAQGGLFVLTSMRLAEPAPAGVAIESQE